MTGRWDTVGLGTLVCDGTDDRTMKRLTGQTDSWEIS